MDTAQTQNDHDEC